MYEDWGIPMIAIGNLVAGYWLVFRIFRGAGRGLALGIGVVFGGIGWVFPEIGLYAAGSFIVTVIVYEVWTKLRKENHAHSHLVFEGGGVKRGLNAVEVAFLLKLAPKKLVYLGLTALIDKGFVTLGSVNHGLALQIHPEIKQGTNVINPKERIRVRKAAARKLDLTISSTEDVLLELLEKNQGKTIEGISYKIWLNFSFKKCEEKIAGFDREETINYYYRYIGHRLTGVRKGFFPGEDYVAWIMLEYFLRSQGDDFIVPFLKSTPLLWLDKNGGTLHDWIQKIEGYNLS